MDLHTRLTGWLLPVALAAGCTWGDFDSSRGTPPLFVLLPASQTGVTFVNALPENALMNGFNYEYYYNGGGVAAGDLNGDDLPDLYFTDNLNPNRLYLNRGGWRFEDVTDRAGVPGRRGWASGVTFADVNGDGRLDIYVSYSGAFEDPELRRNVLYINGGVRAGIPFFTDEAAAYGLDSPAHSTQAAFFDYDRDGDLDAYLLSHGIPGYRSLAAMAAGSSPYEVDRLYRNDDGRFVDVTVEAGLIDTNLGFGLGVSVGDLDNNGWPDIYVANDYAGRDYLYLGQPGGRFVEALERSMGHTPYASMGSDIADFDGDGWFDVAVLEMAMETHYDRKTSETGTEGGQFAELVGAGQHHQYAENALQWNRGVRGDGSPVFSEVAHLAGVARTDWSWAALFADLDNDGRPDLFATTGIAGASINMDFDEYLRRRIAEVEAVEGRVTHSLVLELLEKLPRRRVPNRAYRNEGDLTFTDRTVEWGLDQPAYSNGAAWADLDGDGDLDLVVNNLMGEAFVYRNDSRQTSGAHYLAVRLHGPAKNPFGVGTRVRLKAGGTQQVQELQLTRGYQSSVEPVLHFGLGAAASVDTLEVLWPDGRREVLTAIAADRRIALDHGAAAPIEATSPGDGVPAVFTIGRGTTRPVPRHRASVTVVESGLQPYPSRRDEVALAAADLDGDGLDDFVFGGGAGEPSRIWLQQGGGDFTGRVTLPGSRAETVAAAIFDADADGRNDIWLVERDAAGAGPPSYRHRLHVNDGDTRFREAVGAAPALTDAGVVLVPADFDGDGAVDLFIGGRSIPGAGGPAGSRLLRNSGGEFRDVTAAVAPSLAELRTVTAAAWADVDGNGSPDLIIAGEWMPVTILINDGARLRDATREAGLEGLTGWWQSVAVADIDGDRDPDIIVGNTGLGHPYHASPDAPFELYVHDFDGDGHDEAIPAFHERGTLYPWFGRTRTALAVPSTAGRFPTNDAFARATLSDILGPEALRSARRYEVRTTVTTLLENTGGGRFRSRPLPRPVQVSPVTGIVPADFDGDGNIDLVVAGNIHELDASVPRADAGVGLFLRGDGAGNFRVLTPVESGLLLEGPVRRLVPLRSAGAQAILAGVTGGEAVVIRVVRR